MLVKIQITVQLVAAILVNCPQFFISLTFQGAKCCEWQYCVPKGEATQARKIAKPKSYSPYIPEFLL